MTPVNDIQYVLVADLIPCANKGEEAILRGIEDLLKDERPIRLGFFDDVDQVTYRDTTVVFPRRWVFRLLGGPFWYSRWSAAVSMWLSLQMRLGYYSRLRNLVAPSDPAMAELGEFFNKAEYVMVGHDGVFCIESAAIIHLAKQAGKRVGIMGSGAGIGRLGRLHKGWIYRRAIRESDFCVFRERHTCEAMKALHVEEDKLILAPDPAFAMRPAPAEEVEAVFARHPALGEARAAGRPIVSVTVLEKGVVYHNSFVKTPAERRERHARFVAAVLDELIEQRNAFVLFLPHSIESDASDVTAARHVAEAMSHGPEQYLILDEELGARVLKGIIQESDFLLGERTHSLIGSVSVGTPYLGLTCGPDLRTHGIIGEMCDGAERLIDLDAPDVEATKRLALELLDRRAGDREKITAMGQSLLERLNEVARLVKQT